MSALTNSNSGYCWALSRLELLPELRSSMPVTSVSVYQGADRPALIR